MSELGKLLGELETAADTDTGDAPPVIDRAIDNQLVQVRLGIAASLFVSLRCKDAAAAAHGLRVALSCSAWASKMGFSREQRDTIEVAALLHDIGVIGVPDRILTKPGALDSDEADTVDRSRQMSLEILRASCVEPVILDIVGNVPAWYDGSRKGFSLRGDQLPLGARIIAVVEAFDSLTTDRVYRSAVSYERAMSELFRCAGTQFDPKLVEQFSQFGPADLPGVRMEAAREWLAALDPESVNSYWKFNASRTSAASRNPAEFFRARLLDNMNDAVIFVDAGLQIIMWNRGAERLTGISGQSVAQRRWSASLLDLRDEKNRTVDREECPVTCVMASGTQSLRRLSVRGRGGKDVRVDMHTIPVVGDDGKILGATVLLHDASQEITLEQRCQSLYEKATKDPMTEVANRAEFDRVHETFVATHLQQQLPCSLVICDLDRFKLVNDTYGHQAGDDVIKSLASLLKGSCRSGDMVARYGGEEFVMLYADCDNLAATRRADEVREALSQIEQSRMEDRCITASFGVTEIQPGDSSETMLRRADRALLMAKATGRNRVVQLGSGSCVQGSSSSAASLRARKTGPKSVVQQCLVTPVPMRIAVEKLRGFVADHQARIVGVEGNVVRMDIRQIRRTRRRNDRPVIFRLELRFEEELIQGEGPLPGPLESEHSAGQCASRTKIHVSVTPKKSRNRRHSDILGKARDVLTSFCSYLVASEEAPRQDDNEQEDHQVFMPSLETMLKPPPKNSPKENVESQNRED